MFETIISSFPSALPAIISGVVLLIIGGIIGWLTKLGMKLSKMISDFAEEHEMLMEKTRQMPNLPEEHEMLMEKTRQMPNLPEEHEMLKDTSEQFMDFLNEYEKSSKKNEDCMEILMKSQRHQIKANIVEIYERANDRGYITPMELETMNRLAESYDDLNGNTYIETIVNHANELPIKGIQIPKY